MRQKKNCFFLVFSVLAINASALSQNLVNNGDFNAPGAATDGQVHMSPDARIPFWNSLRSKWFVDLNEPAPVADVSVLQAKGDAEKGTQLLQDIHLEAGKSYTLSAWVRAENLVEIPWKPTGLVLTNWGWTSGTTLVDIEELGTEWKHFSKTFVAPDPVLENGVVQPCQLRVFLPAEETGILWITDIRLEAGEGSGKFPEAEAGN